LEGCGPLAGASGPVSGYEIHMGDSELLADVPRPFERSGAARDDVLGTYLHGLFENRLAREAFIERIYKVAGRDRPDTTRPGTEPHDRAAALVANVDLGPLGLDAP
jgi:adenosylcobyric acid synthase